MGSTRPLFNHADFPVLIEAVFRKAEAASCGSETSDELQIWKGCTYDALLVDTDMERLCAGELTEVDQALWEAGARLGDLARQPKVPWNRERDRNKAVLICLQNALRDPLLMLMAKRSGKQAPQRLQALPATLQGPPAEFWINSIGMREEVPWSIFRAVLRTNVQAGLASELEKRIDKEVPGLRKAIWGDTTTDEEDSVLDGLLCKCFDADGDGSVSVQEYDVVIQKCLHCFSDGGLAPHHLTLERCLEGLARYEAASMVRPKVRRELDTLQRWLQPPLMLTCDLPAAFSREDSPWLQNEYTKWRSLSSSAAGHRVLVLYGGQGTGKTTMATVMVQQEGTSIHASHFCRYDDARTADPQLVIHSLAFQLAAHLRLVRQALLPLVDRRQPPFSGADQAFDLLLAQPLAGMPDPAPGHHSVLLLDGLDEAQVDCPCSRGGGSSGANRGCCRGGNPLLWLLEKLLQLPTWVRFLIITRPDPAIKAALDARRDVTMVQAENLQQRRRAIRGYITSQFTELVGKGLELLHQVADELLEDRGRFLPAAAAALLERAADQLLERSGGSFLYAACVLRGLAQLNTQRPVTLADMRSHPTGGWEAVYRSDLAAHAPSGSERHGYLTLLLELLVAAREPPTLELLQVWLGPEYYRLCMALLPVLGNIVRQEGGVVRLAHKTVHDWLVRPAPAGYGVDPGLGHTAVSLWVLTQSQGHGEHSTYFLLHALEHLAQAALTAPTPSLKKLKAPWMSPFAVLAGSSLFWDELATAWRCNASVRVLSHLPLYCRVLASSPKHESLAPSCKWLIGLALSQQYVAEAEQLWQVAAAADAADGKAGGVASQVIAQAVAKAVAGAEATASSNTQATTDPSHTVGTANDRVQSSSNAADTGSSPSPSTAAAASTTGKACSQCGAEETPGRALKRCGGCGVERYCGPACQKQHWRAGHRLACGK